MIDAWIFVHRTNMAVILDLKGFLINQNYFYQHQNIAIIIEGDSETCTISEFRMIILFLKFIGSFQVAAFSFPNFVSHLAAFVCFLAVFSFLNFPILLHQLQE